MNCYKPFTLRFTFKSALASDLQSDTLFGHICWAIRYIYNDGAQKLEHFLSCYDTGNIPPLLISDGFIQGTIPKPIIAPVRQDEIDSIFNNKTTRSADAYKIKNAHNLPFITIEMLEKLQQTAMQPMNLFSVILKNYEILTDIGRYQETVFEKHCVINRATGSSQEGGLFAQPATFFDSHHHAGSHVIYLKTNYFNKKDIFDIFNYIGIQGYGKDKSSGKGHFECEIDDGINLPTCPDANAFMSLSSFIPTDKDPTNGWYNLLQKYGKLGGDYASGSSTVKGNPFKTPLLMFKAGSTFIDDQFDENKKYGLLLNNVHSNPAIKHYALAFPLGVRLER